MKLTTRGRYAVTAMIDLALHAKLDHVALADVAERQQLSLAYLEKLFAKLRKAGLIVSVRGARGGYRLARDEKTISLADILAAAGESLNWACGAGSKCNAQDPCLTHDIWTSLSQEMVDFLRSKTLFSLAHTQQVQARATQQEVKQIGNIPVEISA